MDKKQRHQLIVQLISDQQLATQQDLILGLRVHGITATQSSISRDINFLGIIKKDGFYTIPPPNHNPLNTINAQQLSYIHQIEIVGSHLIVLKTQPATAQSVASAIDHVQWPEVAGTIAGDDTVFIAIRIAPKITHVAQRFRVSNSVQNR